MATIPSDYMQSFRLMLSDIYEGYNWTATNGHRTITLSYFEPDDRPYKILNYDGTARSQFRNPDALLHVLYTEGYRLISSN